MVIIDKKEQIGPNWSSRSRNQKVYEDWNEPETCSRTLTELKFIVGPINMVVP